MPPRKDLTCPKSAIVDKQKGSRQRASHNGPRRTLKRFGIKRQRLAMRDRCAERGEPFDLSHGTTRPPDNLKSLTIDCRFDCGCLERNQVQSGFCVWYLSVPQTWERSSVQTGRCSIGNVLALRDINACQFRRPLTTREPLSVPANAHSDGCLKFSQLHDVWVLTRTNNSHQDRSQRSDNN